MHRTHFARRLVLVAIVAFAAALLGTAAQAAKPPGGGSVPPGTIYYVQSGGPGGGSPNDQPARSMTADGLNKTVLGSAVGSPSRLLHGGKRWFLRRQVVAGEAGLQGSSQRWDVFAVREDGAVSVRLTSDPTMDYIVGQFDWAPGENASDALVSGLARRWTGTEAAATVVPGSAGLYTARLRFDAAGNVTGLDAEPAYLLSVGVTYAYYGQELADAHGVSWSPDLTRLVADRFGGGGADTGNELRIVDAATGVSTTLVQVAPTSNVGYPAWSPDGSKIAFQSYDGRFSAIEVVSPDGTGRTVLTQSRYDNLHEPKWSPNSAHLAYDRGKLVGTTGTYATDINRIAASGGSSTNLTADTTPNAYVLDWR